MKKIIIPFMVKLIRFLQQANQNAASSQIASIVPAFLNGVSR